MNGCSNHDYGLVNGWLMVSEWFDIGQLINGYSNYCLVIG